MELKITIIFSFHTIVAKCKPCINFRLIFALWLLIFASEINIGCRKITRMGKQKLIWLAIVFSCKKVFLFYDFLIVPSIFSYLLPEGGTCWRSLIFFVVILLSGQLILKGKYVPVLFYKYFFSASFLRINLWFLGFEFVYNFHFFQFGWDCYWRSRAESIE